MQNIHYGLLLLCGFGKKMSAKCMKCKTIVIEQRLLSNIECENANSGGSKQAEYSIVAQTIKSN